MKYFNKKYNYNFFSRGKIENNIFDIGVENKESIKYKAIKYVANYNNIALENIISFGQNKNDYEMLIKSGLGVLMLNSDDELKNSIKTVTTKYDNNESGVIKYLIDFFDL